MSTVKTKLWYTGTTYGFPEICENLYSPSGVGIALSGGGSTAFCAVIGLIRYLLFNKIGNKTLYELTQFISSVSGSSWIMSILMFSSLEKEKLLGEYISPDRINYETLNTVNFDKCSKFIGKLLTNAPIIDYMTEGYRKGIDTHFLWNYAIGKIFLKPYGLDNKYINLKCSNKNVLKPVKNSPFWIANASLLKEEITHQGITGVQFTPYYSGLQQIIDLNSKPFIGGYFLSTYAFNCQAPNVLKMHLNSCQSYKRNVEVPSTRYRATLDNIIGTSSSAYAYYAGVLAKILDNPTLDAFNPTYNYFTTDNPDVNISSQTGDGYYSDNTGIVSLVARGVKKIIAYNIIVGDYDNFDQALCYSELPQLFGQSEAQGCSKEFPNPDSVQVFPSEKWSYVKNRLNVTYQSGGPSFVSTTLDVLPNSHVGVAGGYTVNIIIVLMVKSKKYVDVIPQNISNTFNDPNGPFPYFPNYKLVFTNQGKLIQLTKQQINLLSSFSQWYFKQPSLSNAIYDLYTLQV